MKKTMIRIGDFFFKWRNQAFPLLILAAYVAVKPPAAFLGRPELELPKDLAAIAIVAAGLILRGIVIGYRYIKRGGVDKKVYAADLVTTGMFGVCRNPLYVGNMLTYSGVFLMHGSLIVWIGGTLVFAFIYQSIIYAEERYLSEKFGPGYAEYQRDVPRWGLKLSRFKDSTEGMKFDLGKALIADYMPIANAAVILSGTEIYREIAKPGPLENQTKVWLLVGVIVLSVLGAVATRLYKKSPKRLARIAAQG